MPQGLKQSSAVVSVGFRATEAAPNAFTQQQVDLNLSPLDREVFVVLAINLDTDAPDTITGTNTAVLAALTTTSQTAIPSLQDSNCLSRLSHFTRSDATNAVGYSSQALETPPSTLDYIGIIATNDFFVQVEGTGNAVVKGVAGKMYGYRAVASADIYAALVQSEVLSA